MKADPLARSVTTTISDAPPTGTPGTPPAEPPASSVVTMSLSGPTDVVEGQKTGDYTVSLSHAAASDMTVQLVFSGVAADGQDVERIESVTVLAGESSARFSLQTRIDALVEGAERFTVRTGTVSGGGFEGVRVDPLRGEVTTTIADAPPPTLGGDLEARVSEEGLATGAADGTGRTPGADTGDAAMFSGRVAITDADSTQFQVTLTAPATAVTSGGQAVVWTGDGTGTLVGRVGSAEGAEAVRIEIDANGAYTVRLSQPLDHAVQDSGAAGEDVLALGIGVQVSDGTHTSTTTLVLGVEDDAPVARSDALTATAARTNLLVTLDLSGSMNEPADAAHPAGPTRLQAAVDALRELLDRYDAGGEVAVRLVTFSSGAQPVGETWTDIATAKQLLAQLQAGGNTDYDSALAAAQSAFHSAGKLAGGVNVSYFVSDGAPNAGHGIDTADALAWQQFLTTCGITSHGIGMGAGANGTAIDGIAYDGRTGTDTNAVVVTDLAQLGSVLTTPAPQALHGTLVAAGGADGAVLQSITVDGTAYGRHGQFAAQGGTDRGSFDSQTGLLTVTLASGGHLIVNVATGAYTLVPGGEPGRVDIAFSLVDGDGDTATGTLSLDVVPPPNALADLGGVVTGEVTEAGSVSVDGCHRSSTNAAASTTSGQLTVHDADAAQSYFQPVSGGASAHGLGSFSIDMHGRWQYTLDNSHARVDALQPGQTLTDRFTVASADGTQQVVVVTIHGSNDAPTVGLTGGGGLLGLVDANVLDILDFGRRQTFSATDVDNNLASVVVRYDSGLLGNLLGLVTTAYHLAYDAALAAELGLRVTVNDHHTPGLLGLLGSSTSTVTITAADGGVVDNQTLNELLASVHLEANGGLLGGVVDARLLSGVSLTATDAEGASAHASVGSLLTAGVLAAPEAASVDTGNAGANQLVGSSVADRLYGLGGNDALDGGAGNDLLRGGTGDDLIQGGQGADLIIGGAGDDVLVGGSAGGGVDLTTDIFQWHLGDAATVSAGVGPAYDRISDFNLAPASAGGDVLDLRDLLVGEQHFGADAGNLDSFLHFSHDAASGSTLLEVKSQGSAGPVDQVIEFANVDLTAGFSSDQQVIQELLKGGKLITD